MNRSEFLQKVITGVALLAVPTALVIKDRLSYVPYFKIPAYLINNIEEIDRLCIKKCGAPFKEVGYMDDDFAKGLMTVRPLHRDQVNHYNETA